MRGYNGKGSAVTRRSSGSRRARWRASTAFAALIGLTCGPIAVAEIQVTPRLQVRQTWTDTGNLDRIDGNNGEVISTISPGVQIAGQTNRVQAFIDYTLNGLIFFRDSSNSDIRHQLNGRVNTEVINDHFFVDVRASVRQQFNDFTGQVTNVQQNFTENRQTIQTYAVSPSYREQFGSFATADLTYTYSVTEQEREGDVGAPIGFNSDGRGQDVNFRLNSGRAFNRLNWTFSSRYQTNLRTFQDLRFETWRTLFDVRYDLGRSTSLLGSVGYEEFDDDTLLDPIEGVTWDVGLRLSPGPRTEIEGRVGERFDGTVFSGRLSYAFSASDRLVANYSEDLTVPNRNRLNLFDQVLDADGDGIPDLIPDDNEILGPDVFLTDAVFRQKRASLAFVRQLRKTTLSAQVFWFDREFPAENDFSADSYGGTINGQYRIDGEQSVSDKLIYRQNKSNQDFSDDFVAFAPSYIYSLSPNLNASAQYTYTKRFSDNEFLDRSTNTITLSLTAFF